MTNFFTSDTHFQHANIIKLGAGRPFKDIQQHNEMIIKNWNDVVMPDDTVYHLGDVALGPWPTGLDCVRRLSGRKVLIPGNHDRISSVESVTRRNRFMPDYLDAFDGVLSEIEMMSVAGVPCLLSHYPYTGESFEGRADRFTNLRPVNGGMPLIHGHTHSADKVSRDSGTLQLSVGVDAWNYTPVSEDQISEVFDREL